MAQTYRKVGATSPAHDCDRWLVSAAGRLTLVPGAKVHALAIWTERSSDSATHQRADWEEQARQAQERRKEAASVAR